MNLSICKRLWRRINRRLNEVEKENARRTSEVQGLKKDNEYLREQMDSMMAFIKKLAQSRFVKSDDDGSSNEELIEAMNVFVDRLKGSPDGSLEEIVTPDFVGQGYNRKPPVGRHVNVEMDDDEVRESSPVQKIVKKKFKVSSKSKRRPKQLKIERPPSPLSREQLKLLHDPQSFERYAQDLDYHEVRNNLYSGTKRTLR